MKTIKRYTFRHMLFKQEELTYEEDAKVKKCISQLAELTSGNNNLIDALCKVYDSNVAEELFDVILKPYNVTLFHKIWNLFWSEYYGIRLDHNSANSEKKPVITLLKNSEIMEVLADFFVLNTNWMKGLENLEIASISRS
jgi:hypothetical protein